MTGNQLTRYFDESRVIEALQRGRHTRALGTADWNTSGEGLKRWVKGDVWIGRLNNGRVLGAKDDRHILLCCGARSGKGTSFIVPNLISWPGSCVVIDPKGENAIVTANTRGTGSEYTGHLGQKVVILDPMDELGRIKSPAAKYKGSFNPIDLVRMHPGEAMDIAATIAESLIVAESTADTYWTDAGKDALRALILHVATAREFKDSERNLVTVYRLAMEGDWEAKRLARLAAGDRKVPSGLFFLFKAMRANPAYKGAVAAAGEMYGDLEKASPKQLFSIFQVICTNLSFIRGGMEACLSSSSFMLHELKTDPQGISLFLTLPQRNMETHYRWLRMLTTLFIGEMERVRQQPASGSPILMVLDEFPGLKRMKVIENAAAQIAGFGVKMVMVTQTLAQLKEQYKDGWETLIGNTGLKIFFGNEDNFTCDYVSKMIGHCETTRATITISDTVGKSTSETEGFSFGTSESHTSNYVIEGLGGSTTHGTSFTSSSSKTRGRSESHTVSVARTVHRQALVAPDEVRRWFGNRKRKNALVMVAGQQPIALERSPYFEDDLLKGFYDTHPDHPLPMTLVEVAAYREKQKKERLTAEAEAYLKRLAEREAAEARERQRLEETERQHQAWLAYLERRKMRRRLAIGLLTYIGLGILCWNADALLERVLPTPVPQETNLVGEMTIRFGPAR